MENKIREELKDERILTKLRSILSKTILLDHPNGSYPASVVIPQGLNSDAITGVMIRLGATPDPNDKLDKEKGFGQWAAGVDPNENYRRIYIKHPEALEDVRGMFGLIKSDISEGLDLDLTLVDKISDALRELRMGKKQDHGVA